MGLDSISRRVINNASSAASLDGSAGIIPLAIKGKKTGSFQMKWPSGTSGAWHFYGSNQPDAVKDGVPDLTKFTQIPDASGWSSLQPNGSNTGGYFTFADLAVEWILPFYTRTSGGGAGVFAWGVFF
jgi:hypothetical protein